MRGEGTAVFQVEGAVGCVREDPEVRESLALGVMDRRSEWLEGGVGGRKGREVWNLLEAAGQPWPEGGIPVLSRLSGWAGSKPQVALPAPTASLLPLWFSVWWRMREAFSRNLGFSFVGDAVVCCPCAPPGMTDSFPKLPRYHGQRSQLSASSGDF